jgi:diguanylate cyclase (GGDEF)-like protein
VAVSVAGGVTLAAMLAGGGISFLRSAPLEYWALLLFVLVGETLSVKVPGHDAELTSATSFTFAVLLMFGPAPAAVAQCAASILEDTRTRKPVLHTAFNAGQQALALALAGAVLAGFADVGAHGTAGHNHIVHSTVLVAVLAGGIAYFIGNNFLSGTASALAERAPVIRYLTRDLAFQAGTAAVFLSLSPLIVAAVDESVVIVGLLVFPLIAISKGSRDAMLAEHQSLHDGLTDLPNRILFKQRVQEAIADCKREGSSLAVMIMDLDHFKEINDTLGHHYGDVVLTAVGPRLAGVLRHNDMVARMGGDEFAVLLPGISEDEAGVAAERMLESVRQPFDVEGLTLEVAGSIGISICPDHGDDVETLMQRADVAMFLAKEARDDHEFYSFERDHYSPARLALAGEMRGAVEAEEFLFHYQPKADMRTGSIVAVEALARWQHPQRGLLSPVEFIPIAEQTGLIRPMTVRLLSHALHQARSWRVIGLEPRVAVNFSPRSILDRKLPGAIARAIAEAEAQPGWLKLEITESTIMADPKRVRAVLVELHEMGLKIALDDFGTGYSSLAHLRRLPLDELKIDRSFVMGMTLNASDAAIVHSTIDLAHNLGLEVVAEGVNSPEVWERLVALGCDTAQGFYLSKPLPADEFVKWLVAHQAKPESWQGRAAAAANGGRPAARAIVAG